MMLNKSFGVIYFHFNIFSEKNSKKTGVKICIFGFLKCVSQDAPKHTIAFPLFGNTLTKKHQ